MNKECKSCERKDVNKALRVNIDMNKRDLLDRQWQYTSEQGSCINHLADLKEIFIALEELYKEYKFFGFNFTITWADEESKIWTKKVSSLLSDSDKKRDNK